jgi:hypothetical protein
VQVDRLVAESDANKAAGEEASKAAAQAQAAFAGGMPLAIMAAPGSPPHGNGASPYGADFGAFQGGPGSGW